MTAEKAMIMFAMIAKTMDAVNMASKVTQKDLDELPSNNAEDEYNVQTIRAVHKALNALAKELTDRHD